MQTCPACQSTEIRFREKRSDWICDACDHRWQDDSTPAESAGDTGPLKGPLKIFLSYGRHDAQELAEKLAVDLASQKHEVWLDTRRILPGESWQHEITDGLRSAQLVIYLMSPHSVRTRHSPESTDGLDSVCLGEIAYALFNPPPRSIVPVMAAPCEPPLAIYHLDFVELTRWRDSESQYRAGFDRVLQFIDVARQKKPPRYRRWFHQLQPWDFASFLYDKRKNFTGREWLFDEIDAWRAASDAQRVLLITGDPGIGKSAIVAQLVHHNVGGSVIAYHCCQSDTRATLEPWRFVRSIAAMLASRLPEYAGQLDLPAIREILSEENCRQDPGSAFDRGILTLLETLPAPGEGVRYILIDALDEALAVSGGTIIDVLSSRLSRLPGWLRLVATTRKEPAVLARLKGLPARELRADDPHNLADLQRYIRHRLATPNLQEELARVAREASAATSVAALTERTIQALTTRSGGNFLYVRQALDGIEQLPDSHGQRPFSLDRLDDLPAGLSGMYDLFFRRQFGPQAERYGDVKPILEVICAAREPVTEQLLASAAGLDLRKEFPQRARLLAQFLSARTGPSGETTFAPFHKSLTDWLTHDDTVRDSEFAILVEAGHARLADHGWREFQSGVNNLSAYQLRQLPRHLLETGRHDDLLDLATDFDYLARCVETGQVLALVVDFVEIRDIFPPVRNSLFDPWFYFVRHNAPFLAEHPEFFFQQAYNEPVESPVSQAAQNRWVDLQSKREPRHAVATLPPAFLEWLNRPAHWEPTACLMTLQGHIGSVFSVALSADGRAIVSGSKDQALKVWDAGSGVCRRTLQGHTALVSSVAFSADGRTIASGSEDNVLKIWDAESGACRATLLGHIGPVNGVALSVDGRTIVSGSTDKTVRIWDADTGNCLQTLQGHAYLVTSVALSGDARTIVSGSWDKTLKVWDAESGTCRQTLRGHAGPVDSVAFSADGRTIVSGSEDKTLKVWDAEIGSCRQTLQGHSYSVTSVAVSADGRTIVSGSWDKTLKIWDATCTARDQAFQRHFDKVTSAAVSADGRTFVSGSWDKTLRVWDVESVACRHTLEGHTERVYSVALSGDGRTIISGSGDATLKVWRADSGVCVKTLKGHSDSVSCVTVSADAKTIVSGSADSTVKLWDAESGACRSTLRGHPNMVTSVALSVDGRTVVSGALDRTPKIWDSESGACRQTLQGHTGAIDCVALSADGRTIVSSSWDETLRVWDVESGACRATFSWDSADAHAVWRGVGRLDELGRLSTEGGPLQYPRRVLPNERRTDATTDAATCLIAPGNFAQAWGLLAGDTILAFTANGEAHWFRLRRRSTGPSGGQCPVLLNPTLPSAGEGLGVRGPR